MHSLFASQIRFLRYILDKPAGRYLHAASCLTINSRHAVVVHGGLVMTSSGTQPITTNKTWMFYFDTNSWVKKKVSLYQRHSLCLWCI